MSIPCLIVLMDVRVAPRLLLSSQNTHADPHKETPRNAVCTVCVCVCAHRCVCWCFVVLAAAASQRRGAL